MTAYDAVILAGGAARRMGGIDKPALTVGGRSLIESVLAATAAASRTVVVGPQRVLSRSVHWAMEEPAGGGPAAALRAGLERTTADVVVALAADLPFVSADAVRSLAAAVPHLGGVVAVDEQLRPQWLLSAWSAPALRAALVGQLDGRALRGVLGSLPHALLEIDAEVAFDCDTPADLEQARAI